MLLYLLSRHFKIFCALCPLLALLTLASEVLSLPYIWHEDERSTCQMQQVLECCGLCVLCQLIIGLYKQLATARIQRASKYP